MRAFLLQQERYGICYYSYDDDDDNNDGNVMLCECYVRIVVTCGLVLSLCITITPSKLVVDNLECCVCAFSESQASFKWFTANASPASHL